MFAIKRANSLHLQVYKAVKQLVPTTFEYLHFLIEKVKSVFCGSVF